ncbi:hypothetical protein WJX82_002884 [Trebouxia sp. C0006]
MAQPDNGSLSPDKHSGFRSGNQYQIPASTRLNFKQKKDTKICEELQEADQGGPELCFWISLVSYLTLLLTAGRGCCKACLGQIIRLQLSHARTASWEHAVFRLTKV